MELELSYAHGSAGIDQRFQFLRYSSNGLERHIADFKVQEAFQLAVAVTLCFQDQWQIFLSTPAA